MAKRMAGENLKDFSFAVFLIGLFVVFFFFFWFVLVFFFLFVWFCCFSFKSWRISLLCVVLACGVLFNYSTVDTYTTVMNHNKKLTWANSIQLTLMATREGQIYVVIRHKAEHKWKHCGGNTKIEWWPFRHKGHASFHPSPPGQSVLPL